MLVSAVTKTKTERIAYPSKRNTEILKKIVLMSFTDCSDQTEGKKKLIWTTLGGLKLYREPQRQVFSLSLLYGIRSYNSHLQSLPSVLLSSAL